MVLSAKWQKLILLLLMVSFSFSFGFLLGSRFYSENPIIINCHGSNNSSLN